MKLNGDDEVIACLGSKEAFSHMCLALMGPGDTAIVPAPTFPIHAYSVMLASGNVIALDVRDPSEFLRNIAYTCEHREPASSSDSSMSWSRWPNATNSS